MTFKHDLLLKGYLPENLPPAFTTATIADHFSANPPRGYVTDGRNPLRAATYNASKRGLTRRVFSAVHPATAHDMAEFVSSRWTDINEFFARSSASFSVPDHDVDADRALVINSHMALEEEKVSRLSSYRFIAGTDIARFYHSIYTHSIPWAYHGKAASKADRRVQSANVFFNRADWLIRSGQDGQTVGVPVGPDMSRVFAEVIGTAIDIEFMRRLDGIDCTVVRHVDDVWIGANSHADAERALSRYREAIREFELDINENKTRIYSEDFSFSDFWPSEISGQIEFAVGTTGRRARDRLRSALEHAFASAVAKNDDGILKYVLRYIDQHELSLDHWDVVEPFLKRLAVHFGHTVDYVARILVWRQLAIGDLDVESWHSILATILDNHGRLGNDSEVCWTIYAHHHLNISINIEHARRIIQNCGALTTVALLNGIEPGLVDVAVLADAQTRLSTETDRGRYWPLFLEWKTKRWPGHEQILLSDPVMQNLHASGAFIYDRTILPVVFRNIDEDDFGTISFAIEPRSSMYDDEDAEADNPF
ncbi:RNA-directed DNA polymerase [Sulfitobacter aestuarii]|uniref:RNA-directed DNA polymerase n=1 Tax=Sulfitobacter aestuarii TaxID=2161676 RepID=A0ABW5UA99_9RHOB